MAPESNSQKGSETTVRLLIWKIVPSSCRAVFLDLGARKANGLGHLKKEKKTPALERQGPLFSKLDRCTGQAFCGTEDTKISSKPH